MTPYAQRGDITIYHGDALEVLSWMDVDTVGAVVTDPPYSSGGAFRGDRTRTTLEKYVSPGTVGREALEGFGGDTRDQRGFMAWSFLWMSQCYRIASEGAMCAVFTDWRQLPVTTDFVQASGWIWRNLATWHKPGIRMQRGRFSSSAEYLVAGSKGAPLDHDGAPQNVFPCAPVQSKKKVHIAEKPVPVMTWALSAAPPEAVVLDPFCGSGPVLRAALDLGRRAIGIDADERCCEVAAKRLQQGVFSFGAS